MEYQYIATTRSGEVQRGSFEADSAEKVKTHLREKRLLPISVRGKKKKFHLKKQVGAGRLGRFKVSLLDRVIFARHLSIMLRSGLSLAEALDVLFDQAQSDKMKKIIKDIRGHVLNGETLAASLDRFPKVFSGIFTGMVKVGEASGTLERNLEYVASQLERDYELRRRVRSAMMYPVIVLSATVILGVVLSVFILPKLVRMFESFRMELPTMTKAFLNLANFLVDYGWYLLGGGVVLIVFFSFIVRTPAAKPVLHKLTLQIPILKRLSKGLNLARTTRALSILLKSGVPITESITITSHVVNNIYFQRELQGALKALKQGRSLASALTNETYVPKMANRMINVGEKSGHLEESLAYLASFHEEEVNNITRNLSSIIEPILLIVIGVVLGLLAVAIISPIYQFTGSLGGQ